MSLVTNEGYEILRVLCGSRAYGLNDENSDYDYHSVFVVPTSRLLRIDSPVRASSSVGDSEDNVAWELRHFLELSMKGNPTVLETFIAPREKTDVESAWAVGSELRALFPAVLQRKAVYDAFRGYATSQMHKAKVRDTNNRRRVKASIAYLRTMYHGGVLLREGTYETMLPDIWKTRLMYFKRMESFDDKADAMFEMFSKELEETIVESFENSVIPLEADKSAINDFLLKVRKENW